MRRSALLALSTSAFLFGCPGGGNPVFQNGAEVPDRDPDDSWTGDLADGAVIDIDWASSGAFACWPGTEDVNFDGAHVFYEETQAEDTDAWIRVVPDADVDVSAYGIQTSAGGTAVPPDLGNSIACDASYDRENDSNPGVSEAVKILGGNPYRLLIAVAGPNGATSGGFEVQLWLGE